jgi:hypothetical protein
MPQLEKTLVDKFVAGAYYGKRKIGRPMKYNIRNQGRTGWIELVFNPRTRVEQYISDAMKFAHPYIFAMTYKFHVEKAREAGMRIEDVYNNKFHKEPYIMHHIYAQYFHPETLLERVRDVRFYRQPRTIFKGFKVPDWATSKEKHGWEVDYHSRQAWDNAMNDMKSEWTPTQFSGERQEPNVLQWLRFEQWGCGFGSRLFYNEVPQLNGLASWWRNGGHYLINENDEREQHRRLYSFTHANQERDIDFGIDTTTEEGRAAFKKEWEDLCELAPEMVKKEDLVFPHEMPASLPNEPHFMRVWQHYRNHNFQLAFANAVETNEISEEDAAACKKFIGMHSSPCVNIWIMGKLGKLDGVEHDEGFQATCRVMTALGFDNIQFDHHSTQPFEDQFWKQFDALYELSEANMKSELPILTVDPNNAAAMQALMDKHQDKLE